MSEQPNPVGNDHPATWDLVARDLHGMEEHGVLSDIAIRDRAGFLKYGVRLQPHNGRDSLRDAYEESMDLVVYLRNVMEELPPQVPRTAEYRQVRRFYTQALGLMCALRDYMDCKGSAPVHPESKLDPAIKDAVLSSIEEYRQKPQDATGRTVDGPGVFDPSATQEAHTGHPGTSDDYSSVGVHVANMVPVEMVPEDGPEFHRWMKASLEAEREKHRKMMEFVHGVKP